MRPLLGTTPLALALTGCGSDSPARPPNVVLLVLDTVRADHLGCYGHEGAATPFMDALAGTADRYARAENTERHRGRYVMRHAGLSAVEDGAAAD